LKGTTNETIEHIHKCENEACSEITNKYIQLMKESKKRGDKRLAPGSYSKLHDEVKSKRNLPETFLFPYNTARKRIKNHTKLDHNSIPISRQSPLHNVEDDIIDFLVALSKIGSPVSCGEAVYLINDLINKTIHQEHLIAWKQKQGIKQLPDKIGRIGSKYWYSFLERNKQKIETKKKEESSNLTEVTGPNTGTSNQCMKTLRRNLWMQK
jgi:hypothetical protein